MTNITDLIGYKVKVIPEDVSSSLSCGIIRAIDSDSNSLLLGFEQPTQYETEQYSFAVAHLRCHGESLISLFQNGSCSFAVTFVPDDLHDAERPFDISWWRGGGATIAELILERID